MPYHLATAPREPSAPPRDGGAQAARTGVGNAGGALRQRGGGGPGRTDGVRSGPVKWLWVFAAGGLGALVRVAIAGWFPVRALPWGTLAVNLLGCLAIGMAYVVFEEHPHLPLEWRLALVGGFLGGFTTFSAFGLETWTLLREGEALLAALYAGGSLALGLAGVALGMALARSA